MLMKWFFGLLTIQFGVNGQKPLLCDSINAIPLDVMTEFIYLTTTNRDCAFMFQSPTSSTINLQIYGVNRARNDLCRSSPLRIYYYFRDNLVAVNENFCDEGNDLALRSDSNFALISSPRSSGSFLVRTSAMLKPRVFFTSESIIGMFAPLPQPPKLFMPVEFRAQPIQSQAGFVPSFGVPGLSDSYGAPLTPGGFTGYPGVPTIPIEFTTSTAPINETTTVEEIEMATLPASTSPAPAKITSSTGAPSLPSVSAFTSTTVNGTEIEEKVVVNANGTEIKVNSTKT